MPFIKCPSYLWAYQNIRFLGKYAIFRRFKPSTARANRAYGKENNLRPRIELMLKSYDGLRKNLKGV
jgi:hypothetical protein